MMKKNTFNAKSFISDYYKQKTAAEKKIGRELSNKEFEDNYLDTSKNASPFETSQISVFDPALCEVLYRWFSKKDDFVLDPFAGGSVRGIVAALLERNYLGVDLREEQIHANRENAEELCETYVPAWRQGDSLNIQTIAPGEYDFILTCPPYGDLEIYSDDEHDLSNMPDEEFDETYFSIMKRTAEMLKNNRFAAVVVGNYRDKKGYLRDLCGLTIQAMEAGGCRYYNEILYLTPIGSMPVRITKQFQAARKVGKIHQNVLVFLKGDGKAAAKRLGPVEIDEGPAEE